MMTSKVIRRIANEILENKDWFGPSGQCWCDELKKLVDPNRCPNSCPECKPLNEQETRKVRYLHLYDDPKPYAYDR